MIIEREFTGSWVVDGTVLRITIPAGSRAVVVREPRKLWDCPFCGTPVFNAFEHCGYLCQKRMARVRRFSPTPAKTFSTLPAFSVVTGAYLGDSRCCK